MGGLTTPKGGSTNTTTSVQQLPQYAQDAQQNLLGAGQTVTGGVLANQPNYTQAGFNSDQTGAYDLIRQNAQNVFGSSSPTIGNTGYTPSLVGPANGYTAQNYAPVYMGNGQGYTAASSGGAATYDPTIAGNAANYNATNATAAQTGATDYRQFLNPYTQDVIDPAVQQLRRSHDETSANIGAQAAAAGMFGGSGGAIQQAQNDRALGDQTSSMVANLMSQGYTAAQAIAQANTQLQQQTNLTNAGAQNTASQFNAGANNSMAVSNAGMINQAGQFNAGNIQADRQFNANSANQAAQFGANAANTAAQFNAGVDNTARQFDVGANNNAAQFLAGAQNANDQFNAGAQNTAGQFNSSQALQRAQIQDALSSSDQTRRMAAIQALLGIGNAQQTTLQGYLNQPLQYLQALGSITPQNYGGTTVGTAPNTAQSPLQTLLGAGVTLGAAALNKK